jgi:hypothetical protein
LHKRSAKVEPLSTRPEIDLLLCGVQTCMNPSTTDRIRTLLREHIDWGYVLHTARRHRVMPLLYLRLNTICPNAVPKAVFSQLRNDFYANTGRNRFLTGELLKLLSLFNAHLIEALPYKGPALATSAYGNLALRQFDDLDLLIHKRDIQKAKDTMTSEGYQPQSHPDYALKFVRSDESIFVELHTEITWMKFPVKLDFDDLWGHRKQGKLAGTTVPMMSPEDLLPILCVHGAKHCWTRLAWICDVAFHLHRNPDMDWERTFEVAYGMPSERILFLGLLLAHELLGATLPKEVQQRIQSDPTAKSLAVQVYRRLFSNENDPPGKGKRFLFFSESDLFYLRGRERCRDKLTYLLHFCKVVPNKKDIALVRLPKPLFFLYSFLRPLRLVHTYGLRPLRRYLTQLLRPRR